MKPYIILASVFVASIVVMFFFANNSVLSYAFSLLACHSLVAALFQLFREQLTFDRATMLQTAQNGFALGANSHMANTAFDKHVQFSEEYVSEAHATLRTLFREGPTPNALDHANKLSRLREKYFVWLNQDMDRKLGDLEAALRKLGAIAQFAKHDEGSDAQQKAIAKMYRDFANLLGREIMGADEWQGEKLSEEEAIQKVIVRFRVILGTEELTKLRGELIKRASFVL